MDLELILRTSMLLAAAAVLARLLHRAAPSTRHLVWHLAIVFVVLAPLLAPFAPPIRVPKIKVLMVRAVPEVPSAVVPVPGVPSALAPVPGTPGTLGTVGTDALGTFGTVRTLGTWVVGSWFLVCWVSSGLSVRRGSKPAPGEWIAEARSAAARLGFTGSLDVRQTLQDGSPHVAGLFQSVVMMPPSAAQWSAEERQAAFVHELTHIRRRDRRTQAIAQLACAIYWFNPLVWHAAAGLARERERACDDEVLRLGVKPSAYATLLLDLARRPAAWTPATALSMARPAAVEGRLLMILAAVVHTPRRSTKWLVGATVAGLTTAILGAQPSAPVDQSSPAPRPSAVATAEPAAIVRPQEVLQLDDVHAAPGLTDTLVRALGDASGQVREQAALGLALTPGNDVIDPLLTALKDRDSQVREKAAIGLAFRRDPRIIEPLLGALTDDDGQVREKAAIALGASGDPRAYEALKRATADPDPQVREKAVAGLVLLGLRQ
ncbi:MAG: HEAT repeat domain-containing protein [Vicinamibacterales bacterium]|jgi:beta-lactamase regulating signal transducer with metallopeptidase domain